MNPSFCEVAVIGGGLAGCSAAISLARAGVDVALFEAGTLPRHRVCGEFLSPEGRATLERLGVVQAIESAGARPVLGARFCCDGQSADFVLGEAAGIAISRFALDPILWKAAQHAGARTFLETKTRHLEDNGDGFTFEAGSQKWHARSVILAAGRRVAPKPDTSEGSPRFCGLKAHFAGVNLEPGVVEMHLFRGGYVGLARVEGDATNVCLLVDYREFPKGSPVQFWETLVEQNEGLKKSMAGATRLTEWNTTANVSFEVFRPTGESESEKTGVPRGVLCAGDAAGYIHPLTGDGMAMALRAGELAAVAARLGLQGLGAAEASRLYRAAWQREFASRLTLAARIHHFALNPHWAKPILPALRHLPALRRAMVRGTRGVAL